MRISDWSSDVCSSDLEPARIAADIEMIWYSPPIVFDRDCVGAVKQAAATAGYENMEIVSGAGHDACYISRVAPTAMIFVPCEEGVSHNESESATPEDLRSEEHTSELQSLMRISYAVFILKKNK